MVVKDIERDDVDYLSRVKNNISNFKSQKKKTYLKLLKLIKFYLNYFKFICWLLKNNFFYLKSKKSLGAIPVAHIDNLTEEKLGSAEWIGEDKLDNDTNILKIKGPP